jgi:hypothetical protein
LCVPVLKCKRPLERSHNDGHQLGVLLFRDNKRHDTPHRTDLKNSEETASPNTALQMDSCLGSIDFLIDTTMSKERQ